MSSEIAGRCLFWFHIIRFVRAILRNRSTDLRNATLHGEELPMCSDTSWFSSMMPQHCLAGAYTGKNNILDVICYKKTKSASSIKNVLKQVSKLKLLALNQMGLLLLNKIK